MAIVITRADGGISVMRLVGDASASAEVAKWSESHPGQYVSHATVSDADILKDRSQRSRWVLRDGKIEVASSVSQAEEKSPA